MRRFQITIFISAVLLFSVQPLIAKCILPAYGGTAAVWTTCMMFFQVVLVAGYAYSHALRRFLAPPTAFVVHVLLLIAACATLPITPTVTENDNLTLSIITTLFYSIGLPYFALSTTGSLVQAWHRAQKLTTVADANLSGHSTYRLYALSNLGSLLALLSYPFLIEPYFTRAVQIWAWSIGFNAFACACVWTGLATFRLPRWEPAPPVDALTNDRRQGSIANAPIWFLLAFCASVTLLATTNLMCQEIASVPFLWILPLSLYLLSFMICFDRPAIYRRSIFGPLLLISIVAGIGVVQAHIYVSIVLQVIGLASVCFFVAMTCHGELERVKPTADRLTLFFLIVSIGGACGGISVAAVAPLIFDSFIEFQCALLLCLGLMIAGPWLRQRTSPNSAPVFNLGYGVYAMSGVLTGGIVLASLMFQLSPEFRPHEIFRARNEYGIVRIAQTDGYRKFISGQVDHGGQNVAKEKEFEPSGYYGQNSGFGIAVRRLRTIRTSSLPTNNPPTGVQTNTQADSQTDPPPPINVAVIGMGVGAMLAWSEPKDSFTMFELNPLVVDIARNHFSFLKHHHGDIYCGDGRREFEKLTGAEQQNFDIIAMDAFSSDAIPQHLLTRECFALYFDNLADDGIIVAHITNRFVDLRPVVVAAAEHFGARVWIREDKDSTGDHGTVWILISRDKTTFAADWMNALESPVPSHLPRILWTDDFAALSSVTRWSTAVDVDDLKRSQKTRQPIPANPDTATP